VLGFPLGAARGAARPSNRIPAAHRSLRSVLSEDFVRMQVMHVCSYICVNGRTYAVVYMICMHECMRRAAERIIV